MSRDLEIAIVATNAAWRSARTPGLLRSKAVRSLYSAPPRDGAMWGWGYRYIAVAETGRCLFAALLLTVMLAAALTIGATSPASALPSFRAPDRAALRYLPHRFSRAYAVLAGGSSCSDIPPAAANSARRHSRPTPDGAARAELDKLRGYAKAIDFAERQPERVCPAGLDDGDRRLYAYAGSDGCRRPIPTSRTTTWC